MSLLWLEGVANVDNYGSRITVNGLKTNANFQQIGPLFGTDWGNGTGPNITEPGPSTTMNFAGATSIGLITRVFKESQTIFVNTFYNVIHTDNSNAFLVFRYGSDTKFNIRIINPTNGNKYYIALYRGSTELGRSSVCFTIDKYYHLELKAFISNTTGTFELRINGTNVLSLSGLDLVETGANELCDRILSDSIPSLYGQNIFKMFSVYNDQGSINNDWTGPIYIDYLVPTIAGNFNDAVNTSGNSTNNYNYVNTRIPSTTSPSLYLSLSGSGDKQSYFIGNNSHVDTGIISSIIGFNSMHFISKSGSNNINFNDFIGYNGSYTSGNNYIAAEGYDYYFSGSNVISGQMLHELNPSTSSRWQVSEITGLEIGYEITFTGI